ncbi:MAG: class I SAM-dependent methyltransferase, partial [Oscillatoriales cyanobacterium SM2_2_1]|nr:class I SAM-dependent methyltransferase [Oscillatoriales cyanobacterium SM2_2_1]
MTADLKPYFEAIAPDLDRWHRRNRYYYRDLDRLHQFLIPPQSRILQIGSGTGDLLAMLEPSLGIGIDFAHTMTTIAQKKYSHRPELHFFTADATRLGPSDLPAPPPFDYILLSGVLGYLGDIQTVLERLGPLCDRRTRLLLVFHNYLWEGLLKAAEWIGQRQPQPPQNWLSMGDILNLVTISGYIPIKTGRRFLCPKFLPLLAPLINRYLAPLPILNHLCLTNYV